MCFLLLTSKTHNIKTYIIQRMALTKFQLAALFVSCFLLYASQSKGKPFIFLFSVQYHFALEYLVHHFALEYSQFNTILLLNVCYIVFKKKKKIATHVSSTSFS